MLWLKAHRDGRLEGVEPSPTAIGQETGYTLDRAPVYLRANNKESQTTIHTRMHSAYYN